MDFGGAGGTRIRDDAEVEYYTILSSIDRSQAMSYLHLIYPTYIQVTRACVEVCLFTLYFPQAVLMGYSTAVPYTDSRVRTLPGT